MISGHTQTPNSLFDTAMSTMNGSELKITLVVIRKTLGWHKESDAISWSQFADMSGLTKTSVQAGIQLAISNEHIELIGYGRGGVGIYRLSPKYITDIELEPGHKPASTDNLIYVIRAGDSYKIGVTSNIQERRMKIQNGQDKDVEVVFSMKVDKAYEIEAFLHEQFEAVRVRGEWFLLSQADVDYIIATVTASARYENQTTGSSNTTPPEVVNSDLQKKDLNKEINSSRNASVPTGRNRAYQEAKVSDGKPKEPEAKIDQMALRVEQSGLFAALKATWGIDQLILDADTIKSLTAGRMITTGSVKAVYPAPIKMYAEVPAFKDFCLKRFSALKAINCKPVDALRNICKLDVDPSKEGFENKMPGFIYWLKINHLNVEGDKPKEMNYDAPEPE